MQKAHITWLGRKLTIIERGFSLFPVLLSPLLLMRAPDCNNKSERQKHNLNVNMMEMMMIMLVAAAVCDILRAPYTHLPSVLLFFLLFVAGG